MSAAEMREAAAELAYDMATAYWDLPEGVDYSGEDLRALSDRIRALPLPDEEGMVERVAEALRLSIDQEVHRQFGPNALFAFAEIARLSRPMPLNFSEMARAALRAINGGEP